MKHEIADKWIADLRAGPPQAKGALFDGKGHCCLGRLCVLYGLKPKPIDGNGQYGFLGEKGSLPAEVIEWAGMNSNDGSFVNDEGELSDLASINDSGKSFAEIADIIAAYNDEL
jgi:hypothetical protein